MVFPWSNQRQKQIDELTRRVRTQDALIEELAQRAGVSDRELERMRDSVGPRISDEVRAHIAAGELIPAIKRYREETGAGLAEAKQIIDAEVAKRG